MKKFTKKIYLRNSGKLLLTLLGLMGFMFSCKHAEKYGTPTADFVLKATVKSKADLSNLPDIKVSFNNQSGQTYASGYIELVVPDFPDPHTYNVSFHDLDTLNNGHFMDKDTTLSYSGNFSGGDGEWYEGKEEKVITVLLDPKP